MTDSNRLVLDVPEAGAKLGLGRNASYAAAKHSDNQDWQTLEGSRSGS
jgi:hypothetical protein